MIKRIEEKKTRWNTTVKIPDYQVEKIEELRKFLDISHYRSLSDFVVKAVENEIRIATLKSGLSEPGKYHFDMLFNAKLIEVYEKAVDYDKHIPDSKAYLEEQKRHKEELEEMKESWKKISEKNKTNGLGLS